MLGSVNNSMSHSWCSVTEPSAETCDSESNNNAAV